MARLRGSAGRASRFSGRQYSRGYDVGYPKPFELTLGPWKGIWPMGQRNVPTSALQLLDNGVLRYGAAMGLWSRVDTAFTNVPITARDFVVYGKETHFIACAVPDFTGRLHIVCVRSGVADLDVDVAAASGSMTYIPMAAWQNKMYFSFPGATKLYAINMQTDTLENFADTPEAMFLQVVNNNMCAVVASGAGYLLKWSVDSNMTDFLGVGSGQAVIDGSLGKPYGFELYGSDAIVLCEHGAVQASPTGSASPAFRLTPRDDISGMLGAYLCSRYGLKLFYVNRSGQVVCYDGTEHEVGEGHNLLNPYYAISVNVSEHLRLVLVGYVGGGDAGTLLLDPETLQWVGTWKEYAYTLADSPDGYTRAYGWPSDAEEFVRMTLRQWPNEYLVASPFTGLTLRTGRYFFEREIWIDHIDVVRTRVGTPAPMHLKLTREYMHTNGAHDDVVEMSPHSAGVMDKGSFWRYFINAPATALQIELSDDENVWTRDDGIDRIIVCGQETQPNV